MRKVLFIVFFLIAPALLFGYGIDAETLEVLKKADKIQRFFKANKSDKWIYRFDNQNHIFLWEGKSFSFKREDIVLIVHNRNSLNNTNWVKTSLEVPLGLLEILCQSDRITYSKGKTHEREI